METQAPKSHKTCDVDFCTLWAETDTQSFQWITVSARAQMNGPSNPKLFTGLGSVSTFSHHGNSELY